jgi:hypothetical protein
MVAAKELSLTPGKRDSALAGLQRIPGTRLALVWLPGVTAHYVQTTDDGEGNKNVDDLQLCKFRKHERAPSAGCDLPTIRGSH